SLTACLGAPKRGRAAQKSFWDRGRVTRRRLLDIAGGGAAGAFLLACSSGGSKSDSSARSNSTGGDAGPPRKGGTFRTTGNWFPDAGRPNQDPYVMYGQIGQYMSSTSAMLVTQNQADDNPANWKLLPDTAASWESPDQTTIVFHID